MRPKIVFSYWDTNYRPPWFEMFACSNHFAQSHGYKTILFTDDRGEKELERVPYTEVRKFPRNAFEGIPKTLWNCAKLMAMQAMDEPYYHLDNDVYLYNDVLMDFWDTPFVVFHRETWLHRMSNYTNMHNEISNLPPYLPDNYLEKLGSHNFGIVGGAAYKELGGVCEDLLDYAKKNSREITAYRRLKQGNFFIVLFEQGWIPMMMEQKEGIKVATVLKAGGFVSLLKEMEKAGVSHFMSYAKNHFKHQINDYYYKLKPQLRY